MAESDGRDVEGRLDRCALNGRATAPIRRPGCGGPASSSNSSVDRGRSPFVIGNPPPPILPLQPWETFFAGKISLAGWQGWLWLWEDGGRRVKRNPNKISKRPGFAAEWEFAVCRSRITSMPVSSAPMTRTPPGSSVRFRGCSASCLRWRQLLWKCRRGSLPRLRRAVFGAQREQPSNRGNVTGHSRLT
jgi:hypothetical protein